jgi:hypothetical protein
MPWKDELVDEPPAIEDGQALIPTRPGAGADLDEAVTRKHPWQSGRAGLFRCEDVPPIVRNAVLADERVSMLVSSMSGGGRADA